MSYVFCPECGAPCSNAALQCPRCGFPIQYYEDWDICSQCGKLYRKVIPQCPQCGSTTLHDADDDVIMSMAYNPFAEPDHYASDYSNRWKPFREKHDPEDVIAINPDLPLSLIERLSQSPSEDVRLGIAANPRTPASTLMRLLQDSSYYVRVFVGRNPSTPIEMLKEIAATDDEETRVYLALNPNITPEIIDLLLTDEHLDVLAALSKNQAIPEAYKARVKQRISDYWRNERADHHFHDPHDPYEGDEPMDDRYLPVIGADIDDPLDGWHFDEDNGWLDYYPEN